MKLIIKKFNNLKNEVAVKFPAIIEGANGTGKSTVFRAFCFVLGQADPKPYNGSIQQFKGRIYDENAKLSTELYVEVQLEADNGTIFARKATPTPSQIRNFEAGEEVEFSVQNTYFINLIPVSEKEYIEKIIDVFGNDIQSQIDLAAFDKLSNVQKRELFIEILGIKKEDYFDEIIKGEHLAMLSSKNKEVLLLKNEIKIGEEKINNAKSILGKNEAAALAIITNKDESLIKEIAKINDEIATQTPKLSNDDVIYNNVIYNQIGELKKMEIPSVKLPEKPILKDYSTDILSKSTQINEIQTNLANFKNQNFVSLYERDIEDTKKSLERQCFLQNQIENYSKITSSAKCLKCSVCDLEYCEYKQTDILDLKDLKTEFEKLKDLNLSDILKSFNNMQKNDLEEFESEKTKKITNSKNTIEKLKSELQELIKKEADAKEVFSKEMEIYESEYQKLTTEFEQQKIELEKSKITKIETLKSKLKIPQMLDFSEQREKLNKLREERSELQQEYIVVRKRQDDYLQNKGIIENEEKYLTENIEKLSAIQQSIIKIEKELKNIEDLNEQFNLDVENKLREILPADFDVRLSEKLLGGQGRKDCFKLIFLGQKNLSNGYEILKNVEFLQFLQKIKGSNMPIFIDEGANLVNNDILSKISGNICFLKPNANYETLHITKL